MRFSGAVMDVTEPRFTSIHVLHDPLTRLPNRDTSSTSRAARSRAPAAATESASPVLCIDVDDFKSMTRPWAAPSPTTSW